MLPIRQENSFLIGRNPHPEVPRAHRSANVPAVSDEGKPFKRSMTLDGVKPRDFDENWPNGRLVIPPKIQQLQLSENEELNLVASVHLLRELVLDVIVFVQPRGSTRQALARRCMLHENVITELLAGTRWPTWNTYGMLRTRVPTAAQRAAGKFGDQIDVVETSRKARREQR
jgi:hypothetical protein